MASLTSAACGSRRSRTLCSVGHLLVSAGSVTYIADTYLLRCDGFPYDGLVGTYLVLTSAWIRAHRRACKQLYVGVVWTVFEPKTPPIMPTPEVVLDSVVATRTEVEYIVPAFIEVDPWHAIKRFGYQTKAHTDLGERPSKHGTHQDSARGRTSLHATLVYFSAHSSRAQIYAAAPMNKQIGDRITAEGIALIPFYGS